VILGGDFHLARPKVPHRVVGPAVPELELVGPSAAGEAEDLVAKADPKDGADVGGPHEIAGGAHGVVARLGVAGTVGEEDPSGSNASASAALVVAGTTVTSQPALARSRRMLRFMPRS